MASKKANYVTREIFLRTVDFLRSRFFSRVTLENNKRRVWLPPRRPVSVSRALIVTPVIYQVQGSYTFWPMDFQDFSMTLNQISTTKLKSRYKHEQFRKCCRFLSVTTFPWLLQNFYDLSFFHDFSRPGNYHFKIPWLFQVFHDRTNPASSSDR